MKEVKRHAKVGEYIKIIDCDDVLDNGYENGDIFMVIKYDSVMDIVRGISEKYTCGYDGWIFYNDEYVVLEDYNPIGTKQTQIVVNKINTEELVVPKPNIEIIKDIVSNIQNALSFDFKLNIDEEREEKDMNKVLKLYYDRKVEELDKKYAEKINNDFENIDVVKQYKKLIENFEKEQEVLFKTIENFDNDYLILSCDANLYKYTINENDIKLKLDKKYDNEYNEELDRLVEFRDEVDAQLSLSDDLNYQMEVLVRYDIINKKTNKMTV